MIGVAEGRPGFGALLERLTRWRVGRRWWVVALTLPPAMVLATALLNTLAGAPAPTFSSFAWGELALLFGLYLVNPMGGALGEEPGWRGYALPRLQADRSPLAAALILGVLAAGWHLPLVVYGMLGAIGLVSTVAITVVYVWLFNRAQGSALLILVAHAMQDAFTFGSLGYSAADASPGRVPVLHGGCRRGGPGGHRRPRRLAQQQSSPRTGDQPIQGLRPESRFAPQRHVSRPPRRATRRWVAYR